MFEKLRSRILSTGIARSNRFEVVVSPPTSGSLASTNTLTASCEISALPGRGYSVNDRRMYGPLQKIPYEKLYNEITMTFRCSADMNEKRFFNAWLDTIADKGTHAFAYYDEYIAQSITIKQFDGQDNQTYAASLIEAYPTSVADLNLDQSVNADYHKLQVTFVYKEFNES